MRISSFNKESFSCLKSVSSPADVKSVEKNLKELKITSLALLVISLVFATIAFALLGMGVLPTLISSGFAFLITFVAFHFAFLSIGTFVGSCVFAVAAFCRSRQLPSPATSLS